MVPTDPRQVTPPQDLLTLIPQAHQCTQALEVMKILSAVDRGLRLHNEHQTVLLPEDRPSQPRTSAQRTNTRPKVVMMTGVGQ